MIAESTKYQLTVARREWAVNKKDKYTLEEVFDLNIARSGYKAEWQKVWTDHKLDVILCPGAENTAVLHDTYGAPPYTAVWNLLDVRQQPSDARQDANHFQCPGVIIPVGKADKAIDRDELADPKMKRPCAYAVMYSRGLRLTAEQIKRPMSMERQSASS